MAFSVAAWNDWLLTCSTSTHPRAFALGIVPGMVFLGLLAHSHPSAQGSPLWWELTHDPTLSWALLVPLESAPPSPSPSRGQWEYQSLPSRHWPLLVQVRALLIVGLFRGLWAWGGLGCLCLTRLVTCQAWCRVCRSLTVNTAAGTSHLVFGAQCIFENTGSIFRNQGVSGQWQQSFKPSAGPFLAWDSVGPPKPHAHEAGTLADKCRKTWSLSTAWGLGSQCVT